MARGQGRVQKGAKATAGKLRVPGMTVKAAAADGTAPEAGQEGADGTAPEDGQEGADGTAPEDRQDPLSAGQETEPTDQA